MSWNLQTPFTLRCGQQLGGRTMLAPLTNIQSAADGTLLEQELRWLVRRAEGGFHLTSTCAAYVCEQGKAWVGQLGIAEDAHIDGLTRLASALHATDTTAIVQLHHAGALASCAPEGRRLGTHTDAERGLHGATAEELEEVVATFTAAACRAQDAGFDGVEIHGANGYLMTQFLAPLENPREDAYGGALAGRARLLREITQSVRAAVRPDFIVGARISPIDVWATRGLRVEDSAQVARWLVNDGVDFVHLSLSDLACSLPDGGTVVEAMRGAVAPEVALIAAGGVKTRDHVARARALGCDLVAVGRAGIAHPDWPRQVSETGFQPLATPWPVEHLRAVEVSETFVTYLQRFPGLVEGGKPARSD